MNVKCDYCGENTRLKTGLEVYPHRPDLRDKSIWTCEPCDAQVGCHPGTHNPLGRLANKSLRLEKMKAHAAFDPLWKSRSMRRNEAYKLLAEAMGLSREETHIGMFNEDQCRQVVEWANKIKEQRS